MEVFMKTLKLGALAFGIVAVGSVVAMNGAKADLRDNRRSGIARTARRKSGSDTVGKKEKKEIAAVDDIRIYAGSKPAVRLEAEDLLSGPRPFEPQALSAPKKAASFLTKLKSLPAACLRQITGHPFISVGCAVVVVLAAAVYVVNKKAAQDADVRTTDDQQDDHVDGVVIIE